MIRAFVCLRGGTGGNGGDGGDGGAILFAVWVALMAKKWFKSTPIVANRSLDGRTPRWGGEKKLRSGGISGQGGSRLQGNDATTPHFCLI